MQDVKGEDIGDQDHRAGGVCQFAHQGFDSGLVTHRHGDVDVVDLAGFSIVNQLGIVTGPVSRHAAGLRVMINTDHIEPQPRLFSEAVKQRQPCGHTPGHRHPAGVIAAVTQPAGTVADQRSADHHPHAGEQIPGKIGGKTIIKVVVEGHQPEAEDQTQGPVLQQQQEFGGDLDATP